MPTFKQGDRVYYEINGKVRGEGIVQTVGATCLYCVDYNDNPFHSHTENFRHDTKTRELNRRSPSVDTYGKTSADRVPPTLIGLAGRKGSGKDTAAQALTGYENVKFAGPLKEMTKAFLRYVGVAEETIERCVDGDMKEVPLACFGGRSTRFFMQKLGTEFGRDMIWDNLWVNAFQDRAKQFPAVVCTDMRFPNEVEAVKAMGGVTARIENPNKPAGVDDHPSETAIDMLPVDVVILNDGTIYQLHTKAWQILVEGRETIITNYVNSGQRVQFVGVPANPRDQITHGEVNRVFTITMADHETFLRNGKQIAAAISLAMRGKPV